MVGCSNPRTTSSNIATNKIEPNFKDIKSNFKELRDNSDVIVVGKVKKSYSYTLNNVIFTNYVVDIERQFKRKDKDLPSQIEIRFTGGQVGNENQPIFDEVKPLEIDQDYLFALKKVFVNKPDNNFYGVLGGEHQGIFKVELDAKKNITKAHKFNNKNKIEKEVVDENIEGLLKNN